MVTSYESTIKISDFLNVNYYVSLLSDLFLQNVDNFQNCNLQYSLNYPARRLKNVLYSKIKNYIIYNELEAIITHRLERSKFKKSPSSCLIDKFRRNLFKPARSRVIVRPLRLISRFGLANVRTVDRQVKI